MSQAVDGTSAARSGVKVGGKRPRGVTEKDDPTAELRSKWQVQEKHKLLEGVRRYGADSFDAVARMVKTRTPEEVEAFIEDIRRNIPDRPPRKKRRDLFGDVHLSEAEPILQDFFCFASHFEQSEVVKKSPIERWTELITEMSYYEPHDYSLEIPRVFGLIARSEQIGASGVPRLNWRKIYQFISDVLEDKADIQELSDVESHIVIDMIQHLGSMLHNSDTEELQKMLSIKYALFNTEGTNQELRKTRIANLYKAFSNSFNTKGSIESFMASQNEDRNSRESQSHTSIKASTSSIKASTSSHALLNDKLKATPSSTHLNNSVTESHLTNEAMYVEDSVKLSASQGKAEISALQEEPVAVDNMQASSSQAQEQGGQSQLEQTEEELHQVEESSQRFPGLAQRPIRKVFKKPPLFSLNPLCIPTSMLTLKPKIELI